MNMNRKNHKNHNASHVALTKCFYCGEDDKLILHTHLGDVSPYHGKVVDMEPCTECADFMERGIILIGIDAARSTPGWDEPDHGNRRIPDPYRTGHFLVVSPSLIERLVNNQTLATHILKMRWAFIPHEIAEQLAAQHTTNTNPDAERN